MWRGGVKGGGGGWKEKWENGVLRSFVFDEAMTERTSKEHNKQATWTGGVNQKRLYCNAHSANIATHWSVYSTFRSLRCCDMSSLCIPVSGLIVHPVQHMQHSFDPLCGRCFIAFDFVFVAARQTASSQT